MIFRAALVITICLSYFDVCQIGGILFCYALYKCVCIYLCFVEVFRVRNLGIFLFFLFFHAGFMPFCFVYILLY